ncbi:MAG: vanadium nitrogenase [Lachnospiraceae bacterium]|nr:vanadium nitrogenase [Lachnospiraceae bacterium]MDD7076828.1 vanadium nitrogenase [Lachnospiraceae bacterium]MDY3729798.1 vanadium nitrogenase [Candidatus Choladocola sp.]
MAAFISEFIVELVKLICLIGVSLAAIFCGKKLRDRKDAKRASEMESEK